MTKEVRTMAMRALDTRKIAYQVRQFPEMLHDAKLVADALAMPPSQVFKTLVLVCEGASTTRPLLVMVPADQEIDLRQLARAMRVKSVRMASQKQAETLTGLKVGGISALALLNRPFDVYLDESALMYEQICVSGGQRGVDLQLCVSDLQQVTNAQVVRATTQKE